MAVDRVMSSLSGIGGEGATQMGRPGRISRLRICGDGRKIRHLVRFYVASDEAPVSCYLCVWVNTYYMHSPRE